MEKEKLIIKNFGPIKEVDLDLGRFNILIGEQATGKSTVAKVLAVCRYFSYITSEITDITHAFSIGLSAWGLNEYVQSNSFIYYKCAHYTFSSQSVVITYQTGENEDGTQNFSDSAYFECSLVPNSIQFEKLLEELKKIKPLNQALSGFNLNNWRIPTSFFLNDVKSIMDNPFYFPTGRSLQSIFSIGQSSIQNLSDALFNQLSRLDGIARLFKKETYIEPLDIYYVNRDGHGFIRKANETEFYSLYNAASGYQAIIPIVLVIKYYTESRKKSKTLLIEEPELDVFPTAQNRLMQYIVEQTSKYNSMVLVTTHSPYTLTSINNMMYAYQTGKIDPTETSKVLDKKYWMNPDDVSAYMLTPDGGYEDIFDREEGMIKAEKIDAVSSKLNEAFDELLKIEFKKNEPDS